MTETSPGARAVSALEIIDVFMVESNCHVARDFNQTEMMPRITFQHRLSPEREGIAQVRTAVDSGDEINVIRYFIDGGLRVLRPNTSTSIATANEVKAQDVLAEIVVKLAVDYTCPKAFLQDKDAIGAFGKNAVFHAWSYWRSLIHSFSDQMRLPRVTLPMLRQHSIGPMQPFENSSGKLSAPNSGRDRPIANQKRLPVAPVTLKRAPKGKRPEAGGSNIRRKK
jgi:hypothetical protein